MTLSAILEMANAGRELSETSKRPAATLSDSLRTASAGESRRGTSREAINKWSHNNTMAPKRPIATRPIGRSRKSGASVNLILSIAFTSLVLAAIHSDALAGDTVNSSGARSQPAPPPSSPSHQSDNNHNKQQQHQELAASQQNQKLLQQPATGSSGAPMTKPSVQLNSESPSINLIPIDQPMLSIDSAAAAAPSPTSPASIARTMILANAKQKDSYDGSRLNLRSGQVEAPHSDSSSQPAAGQHEAPSDDFSGQSQQQQSIVDEEFAEPLGQYYANQNADLNGPATSLQQTSGANAEDQQLDSSQAPHTKQGQSSRQLERRFGLFKKGHFQQQQHFGTPANYLANPFMSECERCLAGFSQQQTAELQLDPTPPLPAPSQPPPMQPIQPLPPATLPPPMSHFPMQPFAPFKNKFFMKFPFLMKGNSGGGGGFDHVHAPLLAAPSLTSYQSPAHYWPLPTQTYSGHHNSHHQHRPMSQALFVRPAPAYNCVQAPPTMLTAAASTTSQAELIPLLGQTKGSALTSGGGATKQHHYANQHHHHQQQQQQQVQSGYAKK